jgi:hypothetical protein
MFPSSNHYLDELSNDGKFKQSTSSSSTIQGELHDFYTRAKEQHQQQECVDCVVGESPFESVSQNQCLNSNDNLQTTLNEEKEINIDVLLQMLVDYKASFQWMLALVKQDIVAAKDTVQYFKKRAAIE